MLPVFFVYLRIFIVYGSAFLGLVFMAIVIGAVEIDDVIKILNLTKSQADVVKSVFGKMQEVTKNIVGIFAEIINKALVSIGFNKLDPSAIDINKVIPKN